MSATLGGAAAVALAARGATTVLLGRNPETVHARTRLARERALRAEGRNPEPDISVQVVDSSDLDSVRPAAAEIVSRYPALDGLVLSVGAYVQNGPVVLPGPRLPGATPNATNLDTLLYIEYS